MSVPSSYTDQQVVDDLKASAAANGGDDYKCIVTFFYYGGIDTHNILIPKGSNSNKSIYYDLRTEGGVGIPEDDLLELNSDWGIHPSLTYFKTLWDDGDLSFVFDTGTLNYPTTKEQFTSDFTYYAPNGLFGHNTQQEDWMTTSEVAGTGWTGRTAALIDGGPDNEPYFNPDQNADSSSFSFQGSDIQSTPFSPVFKVNYPPQTLQPPSSFWGYVTEDNLNNADAEMYHDNLSTVSKGTNVVLNSFIDIFNQAIDSQEIVSNNNVAWNQDSTLTQEEKDRINSYFDLVFDPVTNPVTYFTIFARYAASVIYSSAIGVGDAGYKQRRQTIFVPLGGWDHHANIRDQHDIRLVAVNRAYEALIRFLKDPKVNLYDSVVIMHGAEFSRTLRSNGNQGTDHAWASHTFIAGGPVNGGLYPTNYQPNYDPVGLKSDGSRLGRYIPEVPVEFVYAQVLEWFGIPRQHLDLVLTKLPRFCENNDNTGYIFANKPNGVSYNLNFI